METQKIILLLVDGNAEYAGTITQFLEEDPANAFSIIWRKTGAEGIQELQHNADVQIVLSEYFLPDTNCLAIIKKLKELRVSTPLIVFTANKDFELALDVMRHGAAAYLVKEDVTASTLTKTITSVFEKKRLEDDLMNLEISKQRLEAIRDTVGSFLKEITTPVDEMDRSLKNLRVHPDTEENERFLNIIQENISRIRKKIEHLRTINNDKTVKYIRDIRMIDLS